jgi:hypothetical protein
MFSDTPKPDGKKSNKIEPKERDDIKRLHHSVICRMEAQNIPPQCDIDNITLQTQPTKNYYPTPNEIQNS